MAQAIFAAEARRRGLLVDVTSAGTWDFGGATAVAEARLVCDKRQTPMPKFVSTHISNIDFDFVHRVFAMEHQHVATLLSETTVAPERVTLLGQLDPLHRGLEIEDPIGKDCLAFEQCYDRLRDCIVHYLNTTHDFGSG
jgi:protein-tyrosine-phosphatase